MGHDPTKVLMGTSPSSDKEISREDGDPASFPAGVCVRKSSTGTLRIADDSTAVLIGISAGKDLSDTKKTAVFRTGLRVPIKVKDESVAASKKIGDITFTAKENGVAGNDITVTLVDSGTGDTAVVTVDGTDISIAIDAEATLASTIAAAVEGSDQASDLITATIDEGDEDEVQADASETALEGGDDGTFVSLGAQVKVDSTTGEASSDGDPTGGVYSSGHMTGVYSDGTQVKAALVDMPGGL